MACINPAMCVILWTSFKDQIDNVTDFKVGFVWTSSTTEDLIVTFYRDGEHCFQCFSNFVYRLLTQVFYFIYVYYVSAAYLDA